MNAPIFQLEVADGPLVATAIHDGSLVRPEVAQWLSLDDAQRLREEDPFTSIWTSIAPTRIIGRRSRFEVDLNRPRENAVYLRPEDAWGLSVWKSQPPAEITERSLAAYDLFFAHMEFLLRGLIERHGRIVIFDLHSYNHRREGPDGPPGDPALNPEVNVGTGTMDRARWAPIVDRCITELSAFDFNGRQLDVRENVKFFGGYFPTWVHSTFPESACVLSTEWKKFFMDEWTGEVDQDSLWTIGCALNAAAAGVLDELGPWDRVKTSLPA